MHSFRSSFTEIPDPGPHRIRQSRGSFSSTQMDCHNFFLLLFRGLWRWGQIRISSERWHARQVRRWRADSRFPRVQSFFSLSLSLSLFLFLFSKDSTAPLFFSIYSPPRVASFRLLLTGEERTTDWLGLIFVIFFLTLARQFFFFCETHSEKESTDYSECVHASAEWLFKPRRRRAFVVLGRRGIEKRQGEDSNVRSGVVSSPSCSGSNLSLSGYNVSTRNNALFSGVLTLLRDAELFFLPPLGPNGLCLRMCSLHKDKKSPGFRRWIVF